MPPWQLWLLWRGNRLKTFKEAVRTKDFAVTARIALRPETDAAAIREQANLLRDHVDAILLTDNQFGQVHMSTLSCRNRNRIALLGDLFGAGALSVTSLLLVRGNKVPEEIKPRPKAVCDVTATELMATAVTMKSDDQLGVFPEFFLGGAVTPHAPRPGWVPKKLIEKIDAGAQFVQMPICLDTDLLRSYMRHLVANHLIRRASVIAGTVILPSADTARWMRENRSNVRIPDVVIDRLQRADDPEQEGINICSEHLQQLAEIPGISGAAIMPGGNLSAIPAAIQAANLNS